VLQYEEVRLNGNRLRQRKGEKRFLTNMVYDGPPSTDLPIEIMSAILSILGVMHNWIEGILQHHARVKWGIGIIQISTKQDEVDIKGPTSPPADVDMDWDMFQEEITALHEESQKHQDLPEHIKRLHSEVSLINTDIVDNDSASSLVDDFQPESDSESGDVSGDENDDSWTAACIFNKDELDAICTCLSESVVPSWLEHPPTNLGEKSHGKLKADQWLQLFSVFLPLILPEIWTRSLTENGRHQDLLNNFHDLIACTNILCSYSVSVASADLYHEHYIRYRSSSKSLFPNASSQPNHHYAMHNAKLMKFWGPLIRLSEFL